MNYNFNIVKINWRVLSLEVWWNFCPVNYYSHWDITTVITALSLINVRIENFWKGGWDLSNVFRAGLGFHNSIGSSSDINTFRKLSHFLLYIMRLFAFAKHLCFVNELSTYSVCHPVNIFIVDLENNVVHLKLSAHESWASRNQLFNIDWSFVNKLFWKYKLVIQKFLRAREVTHSYWKSRGHIIAV